MRIMVVDDREEERYLAETLLEASGYEVETATNGVEALERLRAGDFDMVVSDILMPVMDGIRLCQECRRDEKLKDIPFVFYTATYTRDEDENLALRVDADRFVRKPSEPEDFLRTIKGLFRDVAEGKTGSGQRVAEEEKEVLKLYNERLVAKLEKKMLDLEAVDAERRQALERAEHLYRVLSAIRGVNQLIVKEKDYQTLLRWSCDRLVRSRGFYGCWIATLDESGALVTYAEAGFGEDMLPVVEQMKRGVLPACGQQALREAGVVAIVDQSSACSDCPLWKKNSGSGALAARLQHGEKVYGVLVAYVRSGFAEDEEEQSLFQELAGDIAFALHSMELEEERERARQVLRESEQKLRAVLDSVTDGILLADAETRRLHSGNRMICRMLGYSPEELQALGVADIHPEKDLPHVIEQFEEQLGGDAALAAEIPVKRKDGTVFYCDINAAPMTMAGRTYLVGVFRDTTERKKARERLDDAFIDLAQTMSRAMEARDPYTAGHQRRVAGLARLAGERLGLDTDRLQGLYVGALLHDTGKVSIPESILSMPRKLIAAEWNLVQTHAIQGYEILKEATLPWPVAEIALHHHERIDGSGYPDGISGDKLSLEVRITGVCDVVEAMGSHRPYRPARRRVEIVEELKAGRGTKYDALVTDILLEMVESGAAELDSEPA
jgi:PAS domain S-box-containing protein